MQLFYAPEISGTEYTLPEDESKHIVRVLRLQEGDQILLMDGKGNWLIAEISDAHPKQCQVHVLETKTENRQPFHLQMAVAPTKNISRFEWFLEKATEIGIDTITPIIAHRSERREVKHNRLERVIVAAAKQSLKAWMPQLDEAVSYKNFVAQPFEGKRYIAHCLDDQSRQSLKDAYNKGENALILIGPEGDFSPEEIQLAIDNGFEPVSLGNSRLRTETAAIVACHTVNLLNE